DRALTKLNNKEAEVLIMTFGLRGRPVYTLHDIASKFDMSTERIRQIKFNGLQKLKKLLEGKYTFLELNS
ncbi:MAG: hypothetical protein K9G47_07715, partial [Bacteroidales bacterium]|nr:hypothetical protein [Bacteroidales bacterium]